jgi:hypothetical protein
MVALVVEEINTAMRFMLDQTRMEIASMIGALRLQRNAHNAESTRNEVVFRLQTFDMFEQRCQHIMKLNAEAVKKFGPGHVTSGNDLQGTPNIFGMNKLQFVIACSDFLKAVAGLTKDASVFNSSYVSGYTASIVSDFDTVVDLTQGTAAQLTSELLNDLNRVFSTERERRICAMYFERPNVTAEEFDTLDTADNQFLTTELF